MKRLRPRLSICVLTYGRHLGLIRRCLESIFRYPPSVRYRLIVGANAPGAGTLKYLRRLSREGRIDRLLVSRRNLNKCPMMRRMFAGIETPYIWWFDDDSRLTDAATADRWLQLAQASPASTVMWGQVYECANPRSFINVPDLTAFVRQASWYRGLTPPSWTPGGKGEFNFAGQGLGDGRWHFVTGGCWLIRTRAVRLLDWPDRRLVKLGDDVLLGEALRQRGWQCQDTGPAGLVISGHHRRGEIGNVP